MKKLVDDTIAAALIIPIWWVLGSTIAFTIRLETGFWGRVVMGVIMTCVLNAVPGRPDHPGTDVPGNSDG